MKGAVEAKFGMGFIKADANTEHESILQQSTFEIYASGGEITNIPQSIDGIAAYISEGATFSGSSTAAAIGFEVKYLTDNTTFVIGDEASYSLRDCQNNTRYAEFDLIISGFRINGDCDQGILTDTGPGEFYFEIEVDGEQVVNVPQTGSKDANDGEFIEINQSFPVSKPMLEGQCISITGHLWENDGMTENENLGNIRAEHCYPWATNDLNNYRDDKGNLWWRIPLKHSAYCSAMLFYRMVKR